ncbi:MAG: hypothetical protein Q6373_008535 [Candidatus Sigynarchaeota archaeon]
MLPRPRGAFPRADAVKAILRAGHATLASIYIPRMNPDGSLDARKEKTRIRGRNRQQYPPVST